MKVFCFFKAVSYSSRACSKRAKTSLVPLCTVRWEKEIQDALLCSQPALELAECDESVGGNRRPLSDLK